MSHWAIPLLGKPWRAGAEGPDAFDCWGLVRYVYRTQRGVDFPNFLGPQIVPSTIMSVARQFNFRRAETDFYKDWDILLFDRPGDGKHVGVVVEVDGGMRFLHAPGSPEQAGYVVAQPLSTVLAMPHNGSEAWRQA